MKKRLLVMGCIGLLTTAGFMGCGGDTGMTPEEFGKNFVSEKFKGAIVDLEDLDYTVIENEEGSARIKIEGEIEYEETLSIVKQGGKWVLASKAVMPEQTPEQKDVKIPETVKEAPEKKAQH